MRQGGEVHVIACTSHTASVFEHSYTQPHWAHMSPLFLEVPPEWAHLDWLTWWRALTQYLLRPGARLLERLAATLARITMLRSPAVGASDLARAEEQLVLRANAAARAVAARDGVGFADRFAAGVARWGAVRRPLIGVHVRLGDGCWDSKRGGCKYVRSFATVLTRLRQAGLTYGTIFLGVIVFLDPNSSDSPGRRCKIRCSCRRAGLCSLHEEFDECN